MGKSSDDNKDYEEYKVKVPKYDKEGNDITGDKLGTPFSWKVYSLLQ